MTKSLGKQSRGAFEEFFKRTHSLKPASIGIIDGVDVLPHALHALNIDAPVDRVRNQLVEIFLWLNTLESIEENYSSRFAWCLKCWNVCHGGGSTSPATLSTREQLLNDRNAQAAYVSGQFQLIAHFAGHAPLVKFNPLLLTDWQREQIESLADLVRDRVVTSLDNHRPLPSLSTSPLGDTVRAANYRAATAGLLSDDSIALREFATATSTIHDDIHRAFMGDAAARIHHRIDASVSGLKPLLERPTDACISWIINFADLALHHVHPQAECAETEPLAIAAAAIKLQSDSTKLSHPFAPHAVFMSRDMARYIATVFAADDRPRHVPHAHTHQACIYKPRNLAEVMRTVRDNGRLDTLSVSQLLAMCTDAIPRA